MILFLLHESESVREYSGNSHGVFRTWKHKRKQTRLAHCTAPTMGIRNFCHCFPKAKERTRVAVVTMPVDPSCSSPSSVLRFRLGAASIEAMREQTVNDSLTPFGDNGLSSTTRKSSEHMLSDKDVARILQRSIMTRYTDSSDSDCDSDEEPHQFARVCSISPMKHEEEYPKPGSPSCASNSIISFLHATRSSTKDEHMTLLAVTATDTQVDVGCTGTARQNNHQCHVHDKSDALRPAETSCVSTVPWPSANMNLGHCPLKICHGLQTIEVL